MHSDYSECAGYSATEIILALASRPEYACCGVDDGDDDAKA